MDPTKEFCHGDGCKNEVSYAKNGTSFCSETCKDTYWTKRVEAKKGKKSLEEWRLYFLERALQEKRKEDAVNLFDGKVI